MNEMAEKLFAATCALFVITAGCEESTQRRTGPVAAKQDAVETRRTEADGGQPMEGLPYPAALQQSVVDTYHGVAVADPYRWLEDPDSPETQAWIAAENAVTFAYLEAIPAREKIRKRLTALWDFEKYGLFSKKGGRYFFSKNNGLQNQFVLYTMKSLEDEPKVLLDPNKLSEDGTIALAGSAVSEDGRYLAYGLSSAGSDWQTWRVRDIETGQDREDLVEWVKFSNASWTHDNQGFYYSRYAEPQEGAALQDVNYYNKLYYHRLGTPQSEDVLVYHRPDQKEWGFSGFVTDDGRFLVISVRKGTERKNLIFYRDLTQPDAPIVELVSEFTAQFALIDNDGPVFWFRTDDGASRGRVIAIDLNNPGRENWKEIIPEAAETLRSVNMLNHKFVAMYLKDARSQVKMFDRDGRFTGEVTLPTVGSAYGFGGRKTETETFYAFTSYSYPTTIYRYDMVTGESTVLRRPKVDFRPEDYVTEQVFYESKDGTQIPMFITHNKGLVRNGANPTYLYGYGGFNISLTPRFSISRLVWMEMGGVYAVANIRGGGEYGREWHDAGKKFKKQNSFDDFIAAAEWLIENKYTSTSKLAISGASNGGLLVGACMLQRPDLFGAVVADVGVFDMLRFHKFTIGWAWVSDFGSPDVKEEFNALYAYSPLHNVEPGTEYPATLLTTADHDDRVVPAHSFKFAATLQEAQRGNNPILIRIETKAGHGAGKPTAKIIEALADSWAFLSRVLEMDV
jgi:prolyl oligopeptidase